MLAEIQLKCVPIGNCGVGKSTFIYRSVKQRLPSSIFDVDYAYAWNETKSITIELELQKIGMTFFEVCASEDFVRLRQFYLDSANVFLMCFSIVDRESFECVRTKWMGEVAEWNRNAPIILVGMKSDLSKDKDVLKKLRDTNLPPVTYKEGNQMAAEIGAKCYMQCSAKDDIGIDEINEAACRAALRLLPQEEKKCNCVIF